MDEMERKLIRIEAQLSGQSLQARLIATAPLFFLAVGLMTGIAARQALFLRLAGAGPSTFLGWCSLLVGSCAVAVCAYVVAARRRPQPAIGAWGALVCCVGLGALRLTAFEMPPANDIRNLVGDDRVLATVRGHLLTRPYRPRQDWCFAEFAFADPPSTFYLRVDQVETDRGWSNAGGTVRVQVDEPTPNLRIGDNVQAYCWLYRFEAPTNPGQFDLATHLKRRNVYFGASVPSRAAITKRSETPPSPFNRLRGWLSEAAAHALLGDRAADSPSEGLLEALLLGNRENIDRRTYEAFRKTGLLHMISLSGLHLGIFVGIVWWLCKVAGLLKPGRALVCIIATAVFVMVVPPRAPTVRAAVIVWAFCASILVRRHSNPLNTLCLAAIILLLIRPTQLFEVGWQLSFSAVAGILALTDHVEDFIRERTRGWFRQSNRVTRQVARIVKSVDPGTLRLFSMGVAAWIGGAGILLYHFYAITPLTSLWTVLIFPLVVVILTVGFFKIVLFFILPTLSHLLGIIATFGADLLIGIVRLLAMPDINCILIGRVALWAIILYYGLVLLARFGRTRHVLLKKGLCAAIGLTLVGYLGVLKWQRTHRDHLSLTCLNVGHGQAILVQLPGTTNLLFDAGSMYQSDVGSRIVLPFLDYIGIGHLDAVVISHNDIDHINGIPEIVDRRRVDHIYANEAFFAQPETEATVRKLIAHLRTRHLTIERIPGTLQGGEATVTTLWPSDKLRLSNEVSDNDRSLVSQIEFAGVGVLLCSDIEEFAQRQLMALYPGLTARIVVVPHHGSTATRAEGFLQSLRPDLLISSCSRRDYDRQTPAAPGGLPRYFFTAKNGATSICVQASGMVEASSWMDERERD